MSQRRNKYEGAQPGPVVKIHGRKFATVLDEAGTQRFPSNRILGNAFDRGALSLNEIRLRQQEGVYDIEELEQLYRLLGYSVDGYVGIFSPDDPIENPLWDKDETK